MYYEIRCQITGSTITCHPDKLEAILRSMFDYGDRSDFGCHEIGVAIEELVSAVNRREYTKDLEVALAISLTMIGDEDALARRDVDTSVIEDAIMWEELRNNMHATRPIWGPKLPETRYDKDMTNTEKIVIEDYGLEA